MLSKTSQKRVTKVNDFLLRTFKSTTEINQSLKKNRKTVENKYLDAGKKTRELLEAYLSETKPDKALLEKERQYLAIAEVKNLDHFSQPPPNQKLAQLIR